MSAFFVCTERQRVIVCEPSYLSTEEVSNHGALDS